MTYTGGKNESEVNGSYFNLDVHVAKATTIMIITIIAKTETGLAKFTVQPMPKLLGGKILLSALL